MELCSIQSIIVRYKIDISYYHNIRHIFLASLASRTVFCLLLDFKLQLNNLL